jgi:hypothetical protein
MYHTKDTITEAKLKHENYEIQGTVPSYRKVDLFEQVQTSAEYYQRYIEGTKVNAVK